jgi:hypothetical protein
MSNVIVKVLANIEYHKAILHDKLHRCYGKVQRSYKYTFIYLQRKHMAAESKPFNLKFLKYHSTNTGDY